MNAQMSISPRMRIVLIALVVLIAILAVVKFLLPKASSAGSSAGTTLTQPINAAEKVAAQAGAAQAKADQALGAAGAPAQPTAQAAAPATPPAVAKTVSGAAGASTKPASARPVPVITHAAPTGIPGAGSSGPYILPGLPPAVAAALRHHETVVVSLFVPNAQVDSVAAQEARAGARVAGVAWIPVNVLDPRQAAPLVESLDVVQDPAVLVFKRPGNIVARIDGIADRETVAETAASAARTH